MELIRQILKRVQASKEGTWKTGNDFQFEGYDESVVFEHIRLLHEENFLEATQPHRTMAGSIKSVTVRDLQWKGHDFLDAAENQSVWDKVRTASAEKSLTLTLDVMKEILKSYANKKLGLNE